MGKEPKEKRPKNNDYDVVDYEHNKFADILCLDNCFADECAISTKWHNWYFTGYLDELKAKTIVIEYDYIDNDFLDDYSRYYVKCFEDYERKCKRLHFFNKVFTKSEFTKFIEEPSELFCESLRESYLGFIVVKPLPNTIIGRTCLKTYPHEGRRVFPANVKYTANLFGTSLDVYTLAYQEQDSVAAACATSALWSVFQRTGQIFNHHIPTPIEITESATSSLPTQSRSLPNYGLTIPQMAGAIRNVGLEPFFIKVNEYTLKSTIYSYLKGGIPIACAIDLVDISSYPNILDSDSHAVAITGYSLGSPSPTSYKGLYTIASQIDKIYAHDDQVGPFARMVIDCEVVFVDTGDGKIECSYSISTSLEGNDKLKGSLRAVPFAVLIPLHYMIRIPYSTIEQIIIDFNEIIEIFNEDLNIFPQQVIWDIFLCSLNDFKEELRDNKLLKGEYRRNILTHKMPKYIWRALAYVGESPAIELIFDATDIEQGALLLNIIKYDEAIYNKIKTVVTQPAISEIMSHTPSKSISQWFSNNP